MFEGLFHEPLDMVVSQAVKGVLAFPAIPDKLGSPQDPKLMGHCRRAHPEDFAQVADAQFLHREGLQNSDPGIVAEDLEQGGHFKKGLVRGDPFSGLFDPGLVDDPVITDIRSLLLVHDTLLK
jgi:hypothetical protein